MNASSRLRRITRMMRTDVLLQWRNKLYALSVGVSLLVGGALAWLSPPELVPKTVPMALLFFVGGSTLMYVVAMILLERDDGTLAAVAVSPLRSGEYLASKVATLTGLATLEAVLLVVLALVVIGDGVTWPGPMAVVGILALCVLHVLAGVILVVRYDRFSEVLIPMGAVAVVFQLPAFWFVGALDTPVLLAIPSAPPTMLIRGAFEPLQAWEWGYALAGTAALLAGAVVWARRSFEAYLTRRVG